ncbi:FAD-dependent oxidoreductase [Streptomyces sp. NPDC058045]|uniref:FAD-dependent oxidoreductase n=1 Tax=Streptomyces sp. NPDC058045 TaxID=3346311 RepID=UPI0036DFB9E9
MPPPDRPHLSRGHAIGAGDLPEDVPHNPLRAVSNSRTRTATAPPYDRREDASPGRDREPAAGGSEDFTPDSSYYARSVAPALAHRLRHHGVLTEQRTWTGLYDQNRFDGNMILGNGPGRLDNFYVASGFSGHGFMHALGVGRGLTELILTGGYATVDLHRMEYQRILDDRPYPEHGIR